MGLFITFEGIDGSGKSTQIELLKEHLTSGGDSVFIFREPGGTEISEQIRSILLDSNLDIHPVTEVLLFSSARSQLIAEKVIPKLESGATVVLDRFYDSTTAYQGYGRQSLPLAQIHQINKIASHNLVPDLTFYLKLSPGESAKRTKNLRKDRMERAGNSFFEKVFQGFETLAKSEQRFITLDATLPPEKIHQQILEQIENFRKHR